MPYQSLTLPPGIYRNGTQLQSEGRYFDCNLVRFFQGTIQPEGGWRKKSTSAVTGKGRAIISWHDNSNSTWSAVGTETNLYAMTRSGVLHDITPSGFTAGNADAAAVGGYGGGTYGSGIYGIPRPDATEIEDADIWTLDTWGEDMVGVMPTDGIIYQWNLNTAVIAAKVTNSPDCTSLLTTQENILMALAAEGVPRRLKWSDQEDNTDWTPTATNQAGDLDLPTAGRLMQGIRVKSGNLILTDLDAHLVSYTANNLVYSPNKVGSGCGAISRACAIAIDAAASVYGAQAVWMSNAGFFIYNGYVLPLQCDVWDYVFDDLNGLQKSKVTCTINSAFGEITWRYPSGSSTEIDRRVTWNFRENHWSIGSLPVRYSSVDAGIQSPFPMSVASDGYVYEHECGFVYDTDVMPFLESGPMQLGKGDNVQYATQLLPDDLAAGDVSATFFTKFWPDDVEATQGPYTITKQTDVRFGGRQIRVRYDGVNADSWRIGAPRLDITAGGGR